MLQKYSFDMEEIMILISNRMDDSIIFLNF